MEFPCISCQRKDDLIEMKVIYVYVHEGDCEDWLNARNALGPSRVWNSLNTMLESVGVIKIGALGLCVLTAAMLFFG